MSNLSDYLENAILGHTFLGSQINSAATLTNSTTRWIGLITSVNTYAGTAPSYTEIQSWTEVLGSATAAGSANYFRAPCSFSGASISSGSISNPVAVTFTVCTSVDWGPVSVVGIFDNSGWGAGNLLFWGTLTNTRNVVTGDTFQIPAGNLVVGMQ